MTGAKEVILQQLRSGQDLYEKFTADLTDREYFVPPAEGWDKSVFPTMGTMWGLHGTHQFWHLGQLTVCRQVMRKKRVLV